MSLSEEDRLLLEAAEAIGRQERATPPREAARDSTPSMRMFEVPQWVKDLPQPTAEEVAEAERSAAECEAAEIAAAVERRRARFAAGVPEGYRWALGDAPFLPRARVGVEGWVEKAIQAARLRQVVLMGPAGSGKTSLAVRMLRCWYDDPSARGWMLFVGAHALGTARIQHKAGAGEAPLIDSALRASLLVLDDLGAERDTANNAVPDVVFERHAENRPIWVTTGLTREQISARYGAGIARRLFERARVIKLGKVTT